jgi:hypothetical protein
MDRPHWLPNPLLMQTFQNRKTEHADAQKVFAAYRFRMKLRGQEL